jgi:hypothetical protein
LKKGKEHKVRKTNEKAMEYGKTEIGIGNSEPDCFINCVI